MQFITINCTFNMEYTAPCTFNHNKYDGADRTQMQIWNKSSFYYI